MPIAGAVIAAAGAIGSAVIGAKSAKKAGDTAAKASKDAASVQAKAAEKAAQIQMEMFETTREDLSPYREVGQEALTTLAGLYGIGGGEAFSDSSLEAFRRSPDYQVAMKEGISALDKSAAARGLLLSGGQVKELAEFGADLGAKNFGNYANRLMQLIDTGRSASGTTAQLGANTASNIGNAYMATGEAQASGIVGAANAQNQGSAAATQNLLGGVNTALGMLRLGGGASSPSSYVSPSATYGVGVY